MSKIGLLRVARRVFHDVGVLQRCFFSFILSSLEYCSAVWSSAASNQLPMLDRVVHCASRVVMLDVAGLCMFYKIYHNLSHPLNDVVFAPSRDLRHTRATVVAHDFEVQMLRCRKA